MGVTRRRVLAAGATYASGCIAPPHRPDRSNAGPTDARIGFVGDVMLGRRVNDRWTGRDPSGVWGSTIGRLRALDGLVANLECCISGKGERWPGKTYYFRAEPAFAVPALEAAGASVVSLANNHVLDFGAPALRDTRSHLTDAGIAHAGAGNDRDAALEPAVVDAGGLTVATVAFTDRRASFAATGTGAGTAYAPLETGDPSTRALVGAALDRARAHDPDLLVASLHWGPNWETAPGDDQQAFARWLIDRGVDVVHGHSAHVLQGVETYRGRPILYDCGDFVDDYSRKDGFHNKHSALFVVDVTDGSLTRLRIVPIRIENEAATLADEEAATRVREAIRERSGRFGTTVERAGDGLSVRLGAS
jgi:poly-gamma-glutamate synthesis protein (capsule biosynthesis protein)